MGNRRKCYSSLLMGLALLLASSGVACGECYTQEELDAACEAGYAEGYNVGLADLESAKQEAAQQGYDKGYWAGYAEAQDEGYDRGYADGYKKGHTEGYDWGFQFGAKLGFAQAWEKCRNIFGNNAPGTSPSDKYVGSINSNVYHYPSCRYVKQIYPENKIWFSSSSDARAHGYRPCKVCCPP